MDATKTRVDSACETVFGCDASLLYLAKDNLKIEEWVLCDQVRQEIGIAAPAVPIDKPIDNPQILCDSLKNGKRSSLFQAARVLPKLIEALLIEEMARRLKY